MMTEVQKKEEI